MSLFRRLFPKRDEEMFHTHTGWAYVPGQRKWVPDKGDYVITRVVPTSDTKLLDSSTAPCWIVYGRPA